MMSLPLLFLTVVTLWINLVGISLLTNRFVYNYPIARAAGVLALCLVLFFTEHFFGLGARPPLLPLTTVASVYAAWRWRRVLRRYWKVEALFGVAFLYCLAWRYTFPDIDPVGERMPDLSMIVGYMRGGKLPASDLWMSPFQANFYYGFQHYGAALLGRLLGVGPGVTYQLAYCTLVGLIIQLMGSCVARLSGWAPGRWVAILALLVGGSGSVLVSHILLKSFLPIDTAEFLGGALPYGQLNHMGAVVASWTRTAGVMPRDLPMWPMSLVISYGDYHPPLAGFLLLAFASLLIVTQETEQTDLGRNARHALLGACIPIAFISDLWIFPLLALLVGGWFLFRFFRGEHKAWLYGLGGAAVAVVLEYPYLVNFTQQAIGNNASLHLTDAVDRTPWVGWLVIFWPVVGILVLSIFNKERRAFALFLSGIWIAELVVTEIFYNHDKFGGEWIRFNSTLKWWSWVYAGIVLTVGSLNLGSKSRLCRSGTVVLLLPTLIFGFDLGRQFVAKPKTSRGDLSGSAWIDSNAFIRDMIVVLASRPDGVVLESIPAVENSESSAIPLFSTKQSFLGWPGHEITWRGPFVEIAERKADIDAFYAGTMPDPLRWLLYNNVRYILWLPRDNGDKAALFLSLQEKIKSHYFWHKMYVPFQNYAIGFWERFDLPAGRRSI
jgi:uncharacterized membrane protein